VATAASLAIDNEIPVQNVNYETLKENLEAGGQILNYTAPPRPKANFTAIDSLKGIVIDESTAHLEGPWRLSSLGQGIHQGYYHDGDARDGNATTKFSAKLLEGRKYDVQVAYSINGNRATNVLVEITHADGVSKLKLNQRKAPQVGGVFTSVGTFRFEKSGTVMISNKDTDGFVIIDAVRWLPK